MEEILRSPYKDHGHANLDVATVNVLQDALGLFDGVGCNYVSLISTSIGDECAASVDKPPQSY